MTQFQYLYSVKNFKGITFLSNILFIQYLHVSIVRQLYTALSFDDSKMRVPAQLLWLRS